MRGAKLFALSLAVSAATAGAQAHQFPLLTHSSLQGLHFSDGCAQREWSATPENSMTLILSAFPDQTCTAQLNFESPVSMEDLSGFTFETRGSTRRQNYRFEFLESVSARHGVPTPAFEAGRRWDSDALLFDHLKTNRAPVHWAAVRISAESMPEFRGRTVFPLYIRNLRFVSRSEIQEAAAPRPTRDEAPPVDDSVSKSFAPQPAVPLPAAVTSGGGTAAPAPASALPAAARPSLQDRWLGSPLSLKLAAAWAGLWLAFVVWLWQRRRKTPAETLSPLYEINTRTWKSWRDSEGVLHVGGLDRVTPSDLKRIKEMGFHSIWLMGLWDVGAKVRAISRRYGADYQGSPYAIHDYRVSDDLGTEEDLKILVSRAHAAGLRVIADFVPNHMGLDSAWLNDHPEFFIHRVLDASEGRLADSELEKRYPSYFPYRTPAYPEGGRRVPKTIMVAYGRDPYFYPWIDTAQLDYAEPGLRRKMTEVLIRMAQIVDGVRCDMAMLVLREQVKIHRHPEMSWETFNRWMPEEFWPAAIRSAKRVNPKFTFIAETYWSMEGYLQHLGFDYTYNKPLYEAICTAFHAGNAEGLLNFLRMLGSDYLRRSIHFLENHDEERAMNALGEERQRAAAAMICTLPGVALIHQGQMEGRTERLPVQRVVPLKDEPVNEPLRRYYEELMGSTNLNIFRNGRLQVLYSNNPTFISYARIDGDAKAIVIINTSNGGQKGIVSLTPGLRLESGAPYRLHDLFYRLKNKDVLAQRTVKQSYLYAAAPLINQGLYVELSPFDAHIFLLERVTAGRLSERTRQLWKPILDRRTNPRPTPGEIQPIYTISPERELAETTAKR